MICNMFFDVKMTPELLFSNIMKIVLFYFNGVF